MQRDTAAQSATGGGAGWPDVLIVCTGGTFDKVYDPIQERLTVGTPPASERILKFANASAASLVTVAGKDSLDLTAEDITEIYSAVSGAREMSVVVVHGTSRLVENARNCPIVAGKTVVFTGAMVPASVEPSEASFNLGFAVAAARLLDPGVWVAMNGLVFVPSQVIKNREKGCFEPH